MTDPVLALVSALVGALGCRAVTAVALRRVPPRLIRTNVDGRPVPAVLGWGVVAGILAGAVVTIGAATADYLSDRCVPNDSSVCPLILITFPWVIVWVPAVPVLGMFLVGLLDDLRGDEAARGFAGHLRSLRTGRLTGGAVKLIGGGVVALVTAVLVAEGISPIHGVVVLAAAIALGANVVNLLDRAPGRAGKVFLLVAVPLALFGLPGWEVLSAGAIGAVIAALPLDLKAVAMLGDAGANPLGAILGLGLALHVLEHGVWPLYGLVALLVVINLASERWSFSDVIERTRWLARMDHLGRK